MGHKTITIVSEINGDLQAWTCDIKETDFFELMKKYDGRGGSVCGNVQDITDEIKDIYK